MTKTETKPPLAALRHIVEYLIDNGEQNFFENGCEKYHVFVAVMKVAKWLSAPPYGRMDSLMSPEWRTAVAALDGKTMADLDQAIAHWKAERMQ